MTGIKRNKKSLLVYGTSFTLPIGIMFFVLFANNIYWGSDTTILASDAFHQYVNFNILIRNVLHDTSSFFYSFKAGLGFNLYALMSYYLGSFFTPLTYFFNGENMADAYYLFILLKFGLIGLSASYCFSRIYPKLNAKLLILLSTSYALMSFSTSQLELINWLDTFILLPFILLGLHRLTIEGKLGLYYVSLCLLLVQNYFFGYITAIFLTLWFLTNLSWDFKERIQRLRDFIIISLLAVLSSSFMLLPTYLDLKHNGDQFTRLTSLFTENSWYFDLFAKNFVGSYDTTQYQALPTIYIGLLPLVLALSFFTIKSIKWQVKCAYLILLTVLIISFIIQPLNLFWQGMHAPNMFLYRYSWVVSTVLILMAAETLSRSEELKLSHVYLPIFMLITGFTGTLFFKSHYLFLTNHQIAITFLFLAAYCLLLYSLVKRILPIRQMVVLMACFTIFEMGCNTYFQIKGIEQEWNFPGRTAYSGDFQATEKLLAKTDNSGLFYRIGQDNHYSLNDGMKYHYNSIAQFSSVKNKQAAQVLDRLGFRSDGNHATIAYHNNTLLMDSLFAIKYRLSQNPTEIYGFQKIVQIDQLSLFQNQNDLPLVLLSNGLYKDVNLNQNQIYNQERFVEALTGENYHLYNEIPLELKSNLHMIDNRLFANSLDKESITVNYRVNDPKTSQLYLMINNLQFSNQDQQNLLLKTPRFSAQQELTDAYPLFNLGTYSKGESFDFSLVVMNNLSVSFDQPQLFALDLEAYQRLIDHFKSQKVELAVKNNHINLHYETPKEASLLFTLPYDKGWKASRDGKPVTITKAQGGLMKINVPKGKGKIKMTFIPEGLILGCLLSLIGFLFFLIYRSIQTHQTSKKPLHDK